MGKGKGRRRRRANYLASHGGGGGELPAPPAAESIRLPAKLRRIIALKASSDSPRQTTPKSEKVEKIEGLKHLDDNKHSHIKKSKAPSSVQLLHKTGKCEESVSEATFLRKQKREDTLNELLEKFKATPVNRCLNAHKKMFLEEKKKKKKNKQILGCAMHQQDTIDFGEIVDAPPRLSLTKKRVEKNTSVANERLRQVAVEMYRQRKNWKTRPGSHRPTLLKNPDALTL